MQNKNIEELISKNLELKAILKTNPDLIFVLDNDSNFLEVYTNTPDLLFMPIEEFIGKNLSIIIPPDIYDIIKTKIEDAKNSSTLQVAKYDLMILDKKSYFEARILSFEGDKLICIIRDITEEENLRIQLEERSKLLDSITKASPFYIYVYDFINNEFIFNNVDFSDYFHVDDEILDIFEVYRRLFHKDDLNKFLENRKRLLEKNTDDTYSTEVRVLDKENNFIWNRITNKIFERDENNNPTKLLGIIENIEKQKENESKIIESSLFINNVLSISPVFIGIFDNNSLKLSYINKRIEDRLSFNLQEINEFEKSFFSLINEDDKEEVLNSIIDLLSSNKDKSVNVEFRIKDKSGKFIWLQSTFSIFEKNADSTKIVGVGIEISEQKENELKIQDLEKRWQFAIEGSGDGVWDWNTKTNEVFFSKMWKSMIGFEDHELKNEFEEWNNRIHPDDKEEVFSKLNDYFEGKQDVYVSQNRLLCKDGTYKWILARGQIIERDEEGNPLRIIGTHTDINELLLTQEKLINSEKRFKNIIDAAGEYIWEADEFSRYTFVSDRFYKLLGYTKEEVIGKSPYDFMIDEDKRKLQRQFFSIRRSKSKFKDISFKIRRKDGQFVQHSINGRPLLDSNDEIFAYIGVGADITERVEREMELVKTQQKLSSILNEINDVISSVSLPDMNYIYISPSAELLFGYSTDEWFKNSNLWKEVIYKDDKYIIDKIDKLLQENGNFKDIVYRIVTKHGELKWVNSSGSIIKGKNGESDRIDGIVKDITKQKIQENEIRYRESIFNSFVTLAPYGIALTDLNTGKFIEINDKILEPTGYTKEEFLNLSYWDLTPKKYEEQERIQLDDLNKKGSYGPYQKEYIRKDGTTYPVLLNGIRIKDNNNVDLIWSIVEDISDRVEKEKEIKEKNNRLELAEKTAKLGNWVVDLVNGTVTWSDETKRIHEVDMDFVPDIETGINFYAPEVRDHVTNVITEAIKTGKGWEFELPLITAKNNRVWVNAIAEVLQENGVTTKIFGTFQDITDRIRLQEERDSIFNMSLDMISVCGTDAYFKQLNDAWSETLEYSIEEIKSKPLWNFIHPDDINRTQEAFINVMDEPVLNFENRYITKSGKIVWLSWNAQSNPDDLLIYSITRNVTIAKERERELKLARIAAEEANKTKSVFLANMSHEIRTPMNSILGFGEILLNRLENKENVEYVSSMMSAGKTLLTLINDILDLSKIEAGKLNLELKDTNVKTMIKELSNMFSILASKKHLTFKYLIDDAFPNVLEVDEIRIRQILLNLIGNAIKFTDKGGIEIVLKHKINKNDLVDLEISVIDTGIGVKESNLNLIFEEFKQQDDQSTRKYGGTGLGLSISKKLATMMNGEIKVKSELGKGSEFTLLLSNLKYKAEEQFKIQNAYNITFINSKLLIVDDNELNLLLLETILKQIGILNYDKAYTGKEAISFMEKNTYDLVLMDIQMPEMDGIEATQIIKNDMKINTPIIALSALAMSHNIEDNAKYFDDYLTKPIELKVALEVLKKYLEYEISEVSKASKSIKGFVSLEDINFIKNNLKLDLNNVIDTMQINEVNEIANEILQIGKEANNNNIIEFANTLFEYSDSFDIEMITKHLELLI